MPIRYAARGVLLLLVASCLACLAPAAHAQDGVALRAAYQGRFLPEGTEMVVLQKPALVQRAGAYQPEFVPLAGFPTNPDLFYGRDTLGRTGHTSRRFPRTQETGHLYFLYARTPDSTLYWSYSAQKDSLKFDVVAKGVMSVAPITDPAAQRSVHNAFFRPARERVTVVMREESAPGDALPETAINLPVLDTSLTASRRAADTVAVPAQTATPPPVAALSGAQPLATTAPGMNVSPLLFFGALTLLLGVAGFLGYRLQRQNVLLSDMRKELTVLRVHAGAAPARLEEVSRALEEAQIRRIEAEQEYSVLQARYQTLQLELDSLKGEM